MKCSTVFEKSLCGCQAYLRSCSKPLGAASHGLLKAAFCRFEPYINNSAWGPILSSTLCASKLIFTHKTDRLGSPDPSGGVCSLCFIYFSAWSWDIRRVCLCQNPSFIFIFIFICNFFALQSRVR